MRLPELLEAALISLALGDVATTVYVVSRYGVAVEGNVVQRFLMETLGGPWSMALVPLAALLLVYVERKRCPGIAEKWLDGNIELAKVGALTPAVLLMTLTVATNLWALTYSFT